MGESHSLCYSSSITNITCRLPGTFLVLKQTFLVIQRKLFRIELVPNLVVVVLQEHQRRTWTDENVSGSWPWRLSILQRCVHWDIRLYSSLTRPILLPSGSLHPPQPLGISRMSSVFDFAHQRGFLSRSYSRQKASDQPSASRCS